MPKEPPLKYRRIFGLKEEEEDEPSSIKINVKERTCKYPGCITTLSIYNLKKYCFTHNRIIEQKRIEDLANTNTWTQKSIHKKMMPYVE